MQPGVSAYRLSRDAPGSGLSPGYVLVVGDFIAQPALLPGSSKALRTGAVPVLFAGLEGHTVPGFDFFDRLSAMLRRPMPPLT